MAAPQQFDQDAFFEKFKKQFPNRRMEDESVGDLMALIVIDDVPTDTINKVLRDNSDNTGAQYLWLADTHDSLHDYDGLTHEGTSSPIDPAWRSPFVGKTPADVTAFIRNTPKPPKPLCKAYYALLQKDLYEERGYLLICKVIEGKRDPETIPIEGKEAGLFFVAFEREEWDECHEKQKLMEP
ncbi:hypothetical protein WHR41_05936 [Cladosporium halotolerans]|uniref:Uncharacterized protein n=1 Tax=Cladosporium halotolerans TaxID=1052096 RepID=A0AB34KKU3_9PEZI